jgi:type IV pilus assembly protein PilQ
MKRNFLGRIVLAGLLLIPTSLFAMQQLPRGTNDRVFERWEWNNATLSSIAAQISAVSGVDIVVDNSIADERIRLSLRNRTWQEVLSILCQVNGWAYIVADSHILIATATDATEQLIREEVVRRNLEAIEVLEVLTIRLRNTTADEMERAVRSVLSERGRVSAVTHTNSLVIHELSRNVGTVMDFIDEMDREMLQISISAKIVEISSNMRNQMGVQWSFFGGDATGGTGSFEHNTPIAGALQRATFGILDPVNFNMTLEYLYTQTNSEIIAEPQITTIENREARIFMGSQVPVNTRDESGNTIVQMMDAGTELTVTPTVTGQGEIKMTLNPTRKSFEMTNDGPIIKEQSAQTNVVVKDGETIVIAGLTSDDNQQTRSGIPVLMDIPIIGRLFRSSRNSNDRNDLVIFVTPHIIKRTRLDIETSPAATAAPTTVQSIEWR